MATASSMLSQPRAQAMRCRLAKRLISSGTGLPVGVDRRRFGRAASLQLAGNGVLEQQRRILAGLDEAVGDLGDLEAGVHRFG